VAEPSVTRRRFLQATGWTAAGVTLVYLGGRSLLSALPSFDVPGSDAGAAWLQIGPDGRCRMFSPRGEMGQNAGLGLAQIAAEELNLAVEDIELRLPSTHEIPQVVLTAGSMSMKLFAEPTARAAAALRELLRARAAERGGVEPATVEDGVGGFVLPDGRALSYAELAAGEPVVLEEVDLPEARPYTFDAERAHRQVGRSAPAHALRSIVTGAPLFASDVRLPGMLFGRCARPAARTARLVRVDDGRARRLPGVARVVVDLDRDFVGVVGETPGVVEAALDALDVRWELPGPFDQQTLDALVDVDEALARGRLEHRIADEAVEARGAWDVDLRFEVQLQSHAMQEPRAAVARIAREDGGERVEIWTGSQDPFVVQRHAARDLGLAADRVLVHALRMGGAFGGREHYDVERDAVRLARAVGRPVKVQWSREDEFRAARGRPPSTHRVRLRADAAGRLTDWWHAFVSGHIIFARGRLPGWLLSPVRLLGDLGVARGGLPPYAAERTRVEYADVDLPVDLGAWRSLGAAPNTFAIESAIDELARRRGTDPVDFRLRNLPAAHDRLAACLERTRALAEKTPLPAGPGFGRGYACGIYEEQSFVAASADVRVDPTSGEIRVLRMCCAQDAGMAVNPDQLRAQLEGNLTWGLGMALTERVEVSGGDIASRNFDRYEIPRMRHIPEFDVEILSPRAFAPSSAGETGLIVGPPAIANAVRDATGSRPTSLPIRPTRVVGVRAPPEPEEETWPVRA
jgi:CO/xanthine dehydrogenase Mo-binding subunit